MCIRDRYRGSLPYVLRRVSFTIPRGCKVGVVGRTGAGKSSMFNILLRLVDEVRGSVVIDGVDTALLPKSSLRRQIALIPQDPVLLHGTWRYNLHPDKSDATNSGYIHNLSLIHI
eukprot:TRINITY_DN6816_c0_g1_i9.p1 TRINITY_DN6816_c0_g1~~TRINITY_DN6816_c0_g1_i9.p1  ORF type:complete len:115 (+),score=3.06 TRINITY_DN6816_c0_g1_i9:171-515(+)